MGVGSEVYGAVMNGRQGLGIELQLSYYKEATRNVDLLFSVNNRRENA